VHFDKFFPPLQKLTKIYKPCFALQNMVSTLAICFLHHCSESVNDPDSVQVYSTDVKYVNHTYLHTWLNVHMYVLL